MTYIKPNITDLLTLNNVVSFEQGIQTALKDLLGGNIKEMMEAEMENHLGYETAKSSEKDDYRNGYKVKRVHRRNGSMEIEECVKRFL